MNENFKNLFDSRTILFIFAALYLLLGLWCTLNPSGTSSKIGFLLSGRSGFSEYVVVYGGLEIAMGIFFLVSAIKPDYQLAGLFFAFISSATLMLFRTISIIVAIKLIAGPFDYITWITYATEITMTIASGISFFISRKIL